MISGSLKRNTAATVRKTNTNQRLRHFREIKVSDAPALLNNDCDLKITGAGVCVLNNIIIILN